jgi:hypothetical protein
MAERLFGTRVVAGDARVSRQGAFGDRAEQRLHRGLDASARGRQAGVVGGVRVGGDGDEAACAPGALIEQGEHLKGSRLARPQGIERMHQGREGKAHTPQQCFELRHVGREVCLRLAREPPCRRRGAVVHGVDSAAHPPVGDRVGGDRQDEGDGQCGA